MKKAILIIIIAFLGIMTFVSYKYITIKNGFHFYLMEKSTGTFDEVFYDVTNWSAVDYAKHPKISAFILKKKLTD